MYHNVTKCRACGYGASKAPEGIKAAELPEKLVPVLDLGVQPLANDFRKVNEEQAGYAPLKVLFCPRCTLAQLSVVVKPEILYSHYSYVTSPSHTMRQHFQRILGDIRSEIEPGSVVEVGSNDGLFLAFLSDNGFGNVVGIDPAKNLSEQASKNGIITVNDFFGLESAKSAREAAGKVDLIVARHVFCHVNDWQNFIRSLDVMASKDTLICIEVPYVVDQINAGSFDQIYHEHLSYLSVRAVKHLLNESPFHLHRIVHYPIHGGAIMIMIRRNDCEIPAHPSVSDYLDTECCGIDFWRKFETRTKMQIAELQMKVNELTRQGKRICGYGASAKSTVWINACGFRRQQVQFICDSTREKVYCNSPGSDIPIVHEGMHIQDCIDFAIMFAWNYKKEIVDREQNFKALGGKWIVPVPEIEIV